MGTWLSLTQKWPQKERDRRIGEGRGEGERGGKERERENTFSMCTQPSRQDTYSAWGPGGWRSGKLSDVDTAEKEGLRSRQQRGQSIEKNQKGPKLG